MRGVLFICTGNLCRSPMAEALLAYHVPGLTVRSAGIYATPDQPADANTIRVLREHGIDMAAHRSQRLTHDLCADYAVLIVMEHAQRQEVLARHPSLRGRVHTLARDDIADPYRKPYDVFVDCHARIVEAIHAWMPRLRMLDPITP